MKTITALEVRAKFGQVLDEAAAGERFIVERAGMPVAAIVPLADLEDHDVDRVRERRIAAGHGPVDSAALIREDRDHGHRA